MKARLAVCTYATHHTQTRKKLKEFSVKLWATRQREVPSVFLLMLYFCEPDRTAVDNLPRLFL